MNLERAQTRRIQEASRLHYSYLVWNTGNCDDGGHVCVESVDCAMHYSCISRAPFANAGSEIYMSPSGDNSNSGTLSSPVLTLEKCCAMAGSGGTCYVRGGRYHVSRSVVLDGLTDVNIFAYNNEIPIIDGTVIVLGAENC